MTRIVPVATFDYVVFGGTGDLAVRKLLPALYHRYLDRQIPEDARIIAASRSEFDRQTYLAHVDERARAHVPASTFDEAAWRRFLDHIDYVSVDARRDEGWNTLARTLSAAQDRVRVFYLATSPDLFGQICQRLKAADLVTPQARIVLEKPVGHNLETARSINEQVGAVFAEHQIFRIDHYLGKETVQNLMALRFANALLEPLWSNAWIDHVQITAAETVGVGSRGEYYGRTGALRDMVQNHLLQLLCLVAMEPPVRLDQDDVRDEKLKVLRALRPITAETVAACTVRGQYRAGAIGGASVPGYAEEVESAEARDAETFVALKVEIDSWRWSGVPFYLRTGKRMTERTSQIVVQFKPVPHSIFPAESGAIEPNRLVMRLQPDEGVTLHLMGKDPGPGGLRLRPTPLNLSFAEAFGVRYPDAYERLLMDVVRGNSTLFMRRDEVEAAWTWIDPILQGWAQNSQAPKPYTAGTWGPAGAIALIERDGRTWHED
ncbi:glucose-6-phosphate dehydrogenase [Arenibaculum pallidiluteum]|uniref:glucose-6-phosphate dehydrogenase n=1 Tax=Arenibaculum pallidiluteum TaxID=2812559 RepID=UPI001A957627|nr:glucose-6-phosphate dehydrogenase [Arenibaculum pallidiluteum]